MPYEWLIQMFIKNVLQDTIKLELDSKIAADWVEATL